MEDLGQGSLPGESSGPLRGLWTEFRGLVNLGKDYIFIFTNLFQNV